MRGRLGAALALNRGDFLLSPSRIAAQSKKLAEAHWFGAVSDTSIPTSVLSFIRSSITSVWALEALLFLKERDSSWWSVEQLVRELRGSHLLVADVVVSLERSGLLGHSNGSYRFQPGSDELRRVVDELARLSAERPFAIRNAILATPHDKVQVFADAFRIKKE